jgi:predicted outer membrane protein
MTKIWGSALLIVAVIASAGWVSAQEEEGAPRREAAQEDRPADAQDRPADAPRRQPGQLQAGQRDFGQSGRTDYFLANCLLIDNQTEATLGQFAQKRAENDEVRQFAEKMAQEHQQAAEMLTRLAQPQGSRDRDASAREDATREGAEPAKREEPAERAEGARPATPRPEDSVSASQAQIPGEQGQRGGGGQFFVSLKKELAEQCLQSAQKELGSKKGEEFDKCYINSQVAAHQHMLDTLTVFEKRAQGEELKSAITQAKPNVQAHLDEAKALAKKLEGEASGEKASKTN